MFAAKHSLIINRPPEEVWEYVSNPSHFTEWQTASYSAEAHGAPPHGAQRGHHVTDQRNILGAQLEHTYEITEQEPGRSLAIRTVAGPIPFDFTWTLEPVDGGTMLTGEARGDWAGGGDRATDHDDLTVSNAGEAMLQADMVALKRILELKAGGRRD